MDKKNKSIEQLESEIRELKSNCLWLNLTKITNPAIKWAGLSFIAMQTSSAVIASIGSLSGKLTNAAINVTAAASLSTDNCEKWPYWIAALSVIICAFSITYGFYQKALRQQTIELLSPYQQKYEKLIDQNRTSCGLYPDGSTHPDDL